MSYKSPIRLVASDELSIAADLKNINRIQKRVLLELELGGMDYIVIDEVEYSKDDILKSFDELKMESHFSYHLRVFEHKAILDLLEQRGFSGTRLINPEIVKHEDFHGFRRFLSPHLAEPLGKELRNAFKKGDFENGRMLLQDLELIEEVHLYATLGRFKNEFLYLIKDISEVAKTNNPNVNVDRFQFIANYKFIRFLNELPVGLGKLRDDFAVALIELTAMLQKRKARFVYLTYLSLKNLNCRPDIKEVINNNVKVTASWRDLEDRQAIWEKSAGLRRPISKNRQKEEDGSGGTLAIIIFAVMIAIMLGNIFREKKETIRVPTIKYSTTTTANPSIEEDMLFKSHLSMLSRELMKRESFPDQKLDDFPDYSDSLIFPHSYSTFQEIPEGKAVLQLINASNYDVVVFLSSRRNRYTSFLAQGKKLEVRLNKGDILSFYPGNLWNPGSDDNNSYSMINGRLFEIAGYFEIADSSTIEYLSKEFVFRISYLNEQWTDSIKTDLNGRFLFNNKLKSISPFIEQKLAEVNQ